MIKKLLILSGIILMSALIIIPITLEKEDLSVNLTSKFITHETIGQNLQNDKFVLFILNTQCQGCNSGIQFIKEDIEYCKTNGINYLIIFDELINDQTDAKINSFKNRHGFRENVFLISPNRYEKNVRLVDSRRRLKDMLKHIVPDVDKIVLGYPQYFYFKDGKYRGNSFYDVQVNAGKYF